MKPQVLGVNHRKKKSLKAPPPSFCETLLHLDLLLRRLKLTGRPLKIETSLCLFGRGYLSFREEKMPGKVSWTYSPQISGAFHGDVHPMGSHSFKSYIYTLIQVPVVIPIIPIFSGCFYIGPTYKLWCEMGGWKGKTDEASERWVTGVIGKPQKRAGSSRPPIRAGGRNCFSPLFPVIVFQILKLEQNVGPSLTV